MSKSSVSYRSVGNQVPMRIRLLKAASELFAKKGYHATSLMDIARQCGVQKSTVFHHFASKQALALETIQGIQTYCDEYVFGCLKKTTRHSPERQVIDFVTATQQFIQERADAFLINFLAMELMSDQDSAFNIPIQHYFSSWSNALLEMLAPLHGKLKAEKLATQALLYLQGVQVMARVDQDTAYLRQISHCLLDAFKVRP